MNIDNNDAQYEAITTWQDQYIEYVKNNDTHKGSHLFHMVHSSL